MRGGDAALFSYVSCEARVPLDHPLRAIRKIVNAALTALSPPEGKRAVSKASFILRGTEGSNPFRSTGES